MGDVDDRMEARGSPAGPDGAAVGASDECGPAARVHLPDARHRLDADGPDPVGRRPGPGRQRHRDVAMAADPARPSSLGPRVSAQEPAPFVRQESLGYQVNHLARLLAQALRSRIEELGVVPGQFAQLLALYEQDGLTQSELSRRVRIEQPTMAVTLKRMERDGLVERVPDPSDRRQALVLLTERARRLEGDLTDAAQAINAEAVDGLSAAEISAFMRTLDRLIGNLESERSV